MRKTVNGIDAGELVKSRFSTSLKDLFENLKKGDSSKDNEKVKKSNNNNPFENQN